MSVVEKQSAAVIELPELPVSSVKLARVTSMMSPSKAPAPPTTPNNDTTSTNLDCKSTPFRLVLVTPPTRQVAGDTELAKGHNRRFPGPHIQMDGKASVATIRAT